MASFSVIRASRPRSSGPLGRRSVRRSRNCALSVFRSRPSHRPNLPLSAQQGLELSQTATSDEARHLIEATGKLGRQAERDKLLLTLMYRHGLRVLEVI